MSDFLINSITQVSLVRCQRNQQERMTILEQKLHRRPSWEHWERRGETEYCQDCTWVDLTLPSSLDSLPFMSGRSLFPTLLRLSEKFCQHYLLYCSAVLLAAVMTRDRYVAFGHGYFLYFHICY